MKDSFEPIHALLRHHQYDEALSILLDKDKQDISTPFNDDLNHAWYIVGDIFYKKKIYTDAIKAFQSSLNDWPEDIQAMRALANCYSDLKSPSDAKIWLEKALNIEPCNYENIYNYANVLFDLKDYKEAIVNYEKIPKDSGEIHWLSLKNIKTCKKNIKSFPKK